MQAKASTRDNTQVANLSVLDTGRRLVAKILAQHAQMCAISQQ